MGNMKMHLIEELEREEIARLTNGKSIPDFAPGDTVVVNVNVVEGNRKRIQAYEGIVIAKRNRGLNSSFIVRKISSGEGVERSFQTYSPLLASIVIKRRGMCAARNCIICVTAPVKLRALRRNCRAAPKSLFTILLRGGQHAA